MIKASTADPLFNRAYLNAFRALPIGNIESPRQYGQRWREAYKCRVDPTDRAWPHHVYIFEHDEDYTMFMLRWG
jgi:GrpB-like predicted nucleotidyltransferase (UPF0157 family)